MKRCPECLFLYPDSDDKCDFDQTALEVVDDSALEPAPRPKTHPNKGRALPIVAAVVALVLGVFAVVLYYGLSQQSQKTAAATESSTDAQPVATPSPVAAPPSPSPVVSPSPSPLPSASPKASPSISTAHTRATGDPVSTSGPGIATRQGGKPVIVLTTGGKIDADEVWRTKDGVWYRRNGIVTLLKRAQVKNISTR